MATPVISTAPDQMAKRIVTDALRDSQMKIFEDLKQTRYSPLITDDFDKFLDKMRDEQTSGALHDALSNDPNNLIRFFGKREEFVNKFKKKDVTIESPESQVESAISSVSEVTTSDVLGQSIESGFNEGAGREFDGNPTSPELSRVDKIFNTEAGKSIKGVISGVDRGFYGIIPDILQFLGQLEYGIDKGASKLGVGADFTSPDQTIFGQAANATRNLLNSLAPIPEDVQDDLATQIGQGVGQVASLIITGGTGQLATAGTIPKIASGLTPGKFAAQQLGKALTSRQSQIASIQMGTNGFKNAKLAGATDGEAFAKMLADAAIGKTEIIPISRAFDRINRGTGGGFTSWLLRTGQGTLEEGAQEAFQEFMSNVAEKDIFNAGKNLLDNVASSGEVGAGTGFVINAFLNAVGGPTGSPQKRKLRALIQKRLKEWTDGRNKAAEELGTKIDEKTKQLSDNIRDLKKEVPVKPKPEKDGEIKAKVTTKPKQKKPGIKGVAGQAPPITPIQRKQAEVQRDKKAKLAADIKAEAKRLSEKRKAKQVPATEQTKLETKLSEVKTEIRRLEAVQTQGKKQGIVSKKTGKLIKGKFKPGKAPAPFKVPVGLQTRLKKLDTEKRGIEARLQEVVEIKKDVGGPVEVTLKTNKVQEDGTQITEMDFKRGSQVGTIIREQTPEGQVTFIAQAADLQSDLQSSPKAALDELRDLQRKAPKVFSQVGVEVSVEEKDLTASQSRLADQLQGKPASKGQAAIKAPKEFVRADITPREEGNPNRGVRIAFEGGTLTTIEVTPRGITVFKSQAQADNIQKNYPETYKVLADQGTPQVQEHNINDEKSNSTVKIDESNLKGKAKRLADNIRKGKIEIPAGALRATLGIEQIWNSALEVIATTIESGGDFFLAMRRVARHLRSTKVYRQMGVDERKKLLKDTENAIKAEFEKAGIPLKKVIISGEVAKEKKAILKGEKKRLKFDIRELIFGRRSAIDLGVFETAMFVGGINDAVRVIAKDINKDLPPAEHVTQKQLREILPFMIEKAREIPKALNRPDLENAWKYKGKLRPIEKEVREVFKRNWNIIKATKGRNLTSLQIEDYVSHIWDIPKQQMAEITRHFTLKNKFLESRYIDTIVEGVNKFGLRPKMLDISDILAVNSSMAVKVSANEQFVKGLDKVTLGENKQKIIYKGKFKPAGWPKVNTPAMMNYVVHPEAKRYLDAIFEERINKPWIRNLEALDGGLKRFQLSVSFFHHMALAEAGMATNPGKFISGGVDFAKEMKNALKEKRALRPATFLHPEWTRDGLSAGLQIGASNDIPVEAQQRAIRTWANKMEEIGKLDTNLTESEIKRRVAKILGGAGKGADIAIRAWDSALWEFFHDGLKLYAYQGRVEKLGDKRFMARLEKKAGKTGLDTPEFIRRWKREQAQFVNDTFGGQNWDNLMITPFNVQALRWMLLSPDWTISTIRQALAPTGLGAVYKETVGSRRGLGTRFWGRAILMVGVVVNALNGFKRAEDFEENPELYKDENGKQLKKLSPQDLSMFGNSVGHGSHLFWGRFNDGTEKYVRWGKQFRELPEIFVNEYFHPEFPRQAIKKIGGKASPTIQIASQIFTGKGLSGYENWDLKDKKGFDHTWGIVKLLGKSILPFASSNLMREDKEWSPGDLIFPSSKGMTPKKTIEAFQMAISDSDFDAMTQVYSSAVRNNLDAISLFSLALKNIEADYNSNLKRTTKELDDIKKLMKTEKNPVKLSELAVRQSNLLNKKIQIKTARGRVGEALIQQKLFETRQKLREK